MTLIKIFLFRFEFRNIGHLNLSCITGLATAFLESRVFKFFNKIAYSVYLTQFPIFFYNVGVQRYSSFYSPLSLVSSHLTIDIALHWLPDEIVHSNKQ